MNAADVQVFTRVVRSGSFSEAADMLGITRSAVSKTVARLEQDLGVVLFRRSTRKLSLTDAGRRFFRHAVEVEEALVRAEAAVSGSDQEVVGNLAVSVSTSFGAALMPRLVRKFRQAWPALSLSLDFDDRFVDLVGGSFDLAIRIASRLEDSTLRSKLLGTTREVLAASPAYLERYGVPRHAEDLKSHRCIDVGGVARTEAVWRFRKGRELIEVPVEFTMTSNSELALILAACLDEGILLSPDILIGGELESGRLVEVLPGYSDAREWGIYAVYPNAGPPAKVQAFIDFIAAELDTLRRIDRWSPFDDE